MRADAEGGRWHGAGHGGAASPSPLNRRCQPLFTEFLLLPLERYQRQVLQAEHYLKVGARRAADA